MQKEADEQLTALNSISVLPFEGGEATIAMVVPFHFSLSVRPEPDDPYVPTVMQSACVEQLTPDSSDDEPLFGEVTSVHWGPEASTFTAVNRSSAPAIPSTAPLVPRRVPAIMGPSLAGSCRPAAERRM